MHGRYANESVPYDSELARHVVKVLVEACEEHEVYLGDLFSVRKKLPIVLARRAVVRRMRETVYRLGNDSRLYVEPDRLAWPERARPIGFLPLARMFGMEHSSLVRMMQEDPVQQEARRNGDGIRS